MKMNFQRAYSTESVSMDTDFRCANFPSETIINNGRCSRITFQFENIVGCSTFTYYLHGPSSTVDGAEPLTTYKKYSEPATASIRIDATDPTLGIAHIDLDEWPYEELPGYGEMGEVHVALDAGSADVTATLTVIG